MKKYISLCCILLITACSNNADPGLALETQGKTELTVSTYGRNTYLEEAAEIFMSQHQDVSIIVNTFASDISVDAMDAVTMYTNIQGDQSPEKYIKNMNTSIMAGSGSDLIAMDVLPYYKYAESGYLEDLSPYLEDGQFLQENFYEDMLKALRFSGGIYMLPTDYTSYLTGVHYLYEQNLDSNGMKISDIVTSGVQAFEGGNQLGEYIYHDAFELFSLLYNENYSQILNLVDKTCQYDSVLFTNILDRCKQIQNDGLIPNQQRNGEDDNLYYFTFDSIWTQNLLTPYFGFGDEYGEMVPVTDSEGNVYFTGLHSFAINHNSDNKDIAWAFLNYMLSEEMQSRPGTFPVNKKALENGYKQQIIQMLNEAIENGIALNGEPEEIANLYVENIKQFSGRINIYCFKDPIIEGIVEQEVTAYLSGNQTAEDTGRSIQSKVSTYLSE